MRNELRFHAAFWKRLETQIRQHSRFHVSSCFQIGTWKQQIWEKPGKNRHPGPCVQVSMPIGRISK
jgi:hypothetical protein